MFLLQLFTVNENNNDNHDDKGTKMVTVIASSLETTVTTISGSARTVINRIINNSNN